MTKKERNEYQERIAQALQEGDVKKALEIRAEMYRKGGEELDEDDYD